MHRRNAPAATIDLRLPAPGREGGDAASAVSAACVVAALDATDIGTWDWDLATDAVTWNAAHHRLAGIPPEAFDGRAGAYFALVHPDDQATITAAVARALAVDSRYACEYRLRRADDGALRWVHCTGVVFRDAAGTPVRMTGTLVDVTAAHESADAAAAAEAARRESDTRLALALEASEAGLWDWDIPSGAVHVNDLWCTMLGWARHEVAPTVHGWESLLHPDDREAVWAALDAHLAGRTPRFESEHRMRRRDGGWAWILARGKVVARDAAGAPLRAVGTHTDIGPRKAAEASLAASEAMLRELFEGSVLAKVLVDGDGRIVRVNPAFTRLLGHARTALEGRVLEDLVHPDDRATGPAPLPPRRRYLHRDGSVLWVQHTATPLRLADGHDYQLAELLDVTEAHRLEAQLREAQKLEAVGQLAGGIAHDFNNLLTVIRGNLGFLRDAIPPVGEAADDLAQVEHAAARATVLVRQLLAFGRRQVLHPRAVALEGVVADAARLLRRTLGDGVTLTVRRAGHAGAVWADPGQLEQVVVHLALNARDAIDRAGRGGGTITIETATVRFVAPGVPDAAGAALLGRDGLLTAGGDAPLAAGRYAALVVRDTGAGMTPAVRARLFEPFFTTKDVGEGSGLGLATVHGIVAQSGGALHVQSVPGRGSAFAVLLPQAPAGDAVATAPRGAAGPVPG